MEINEMAQNVYDYAEKQGFHETPFNFGEALMLIVSELGEAIAAHRRGRLCGHPEALENLNPEEALEKDTQKFKHIYEHFVKGTVEEEIADALLRIGNLAVRLGMDLDWHCRAKMCFNTTRPFKHETLYG